MAVSGNASQFEVGARSVRGGTSRGEVSVRSVRGGANGLERCVSYQDEILSIPEKGLERCHHDLSGRHGAASRLHDPTLEPNRCR